MVWVYMQLARALALSGLAQGSVNDKRAGRGCGQLRRVHSPRGLLHGCVYIDDGLAIHDGV
jgi:hypothetical protein